MRKIPILGTVLCCLLTGCYFQLPQENTRVAPVRGVVTLNGKPLPGVLIRFESVDKRGSFGMTQADGSYELEHDRGIKGAIIGGHQVRLSMHYVPGRDKTPKPLPARYNTESELKVRVQPGDNVFDFHLTDDEESSSTNAPIAPPVLRNPPAETEPADADRPN